MKYRVKRCPAKRDDLKLLLLLLLSQATRLKEAHKALLVQQWQLEKLEEDRRNVEERRRRTEMG